jgi:hypothetical protein
MPFYADSAAFYSIMSDLFARVLAAPGLLQPLVKERAVLRIVTTGPAGILTVDGRSPPPKFLTGPAEGSADVGLRVPADTLHNIWLSKVRLRDAFLAGTVKLDTSPLQALSLMTGLTEMFRFVEKTYAQVLRERGLL